MDAARRREIASKGGSNVPPAKRPFARDPALAAEAGRKGGQATRRGGGRARPTDRRPAI
jgi:general stress protein YciG